MNKKTFQDIFQSYFHSKYNFQEFLNLQLLPSINIFEKDINQHHFFSYKNNKDYTIESKKLNNLHTFFNNILFQNLSINNCVYSYKKNSSIYEVALLHKNSKYYFKTDIKSFFHSIDYDLVLTCLNENISNLPAETTNYVINILNLITYKNKLPVGFVTSPSISNAILYKFDNDIEQYTIDNNIIYTRYSDDLIFSTNNQNNFLGLEKSIRKTLLHFYNERFQLNESKTQYFDKTNRVKLLGLIITPDGHITVDKSKKENMKQLLYFYKNDKTKFRLLLEKKYDGKLSKAYGMLNYISDIDKSFIVYLRKKYGNFVIDKFLHGAK